MQLQQDRKPQTNTMLKITRVKQEAAIGKTTRRSLSAACTTLIKQAQRYAKNRRIPGE